MTTSVQSTQLLLALALAVPSPAHAQDRPVLTRTPPSPTRPVGAAPGTPAAAPLAQAARPGLPKAAPAAPAAGVAGARPAAAAPATAALGARPAAPTAAGVAGARPAPAAPATAAGARPAPAAPIATPARPAGLAGPAAPTVPRAAPAIIPFVPPRAAPGKAPAAGLAGLGEVRVQSAINAVNALNAVNAVNAINAMNAQHTIMPGLPGMSGSGAPGAPGGFDRGGFPGVVARGPVIPGIPDVEVAAPTAPRFTLPADLSLRLSQLERRMQLLANENQRLKVDLRGALLRDPTPAAAPAGPAAGLQLQIGGYGDVGAFGTLGDGVAYVRDAEHAHHPEWAAIPWVFLGDPWANPINAQGDSADLGLDRSIIPRFDPIRSRGKPTFIVNLLNVNLTARLGTSLTAHANLNFEPRSGSLGSPGDYFDLDLAYLDWQPSRKADLHLMIGKLESSFGIEHRLRRAPDRLGVTPSLICRDTCGTPTGIRLYGRTARGWLGYSLSLTNGATHTERSAHLYSEGAQNLFKTVSGRLSIGHAFHGRVPVQFEVGGSGLIGAQAGQADDSLLHWQAGADARLQVAGFGLRAEYVRSVANGDRVAGQPWLDLHGLYAEASYRFTPWLLILGRFDLRQSLLQVDTSLYITDQARVTGALRFDITQNVLVKLEYLRLMELSGPALQDDVITSSVVFRF